MTGHCWVLAKVCALLSAVLVSMPFVVDPRPIHSINISYRWSENYFRDYMTFQDMFYERMMMMIG